MIRHFGFVLMLLGAGVLAACTSQPAMAPSHVSGLHSGKLIIEPPAGKITILTVPEEAEILRAANAGLMAASIGGPFAAMVAQSVVRGEMDAKRTRAVKILKPYANLIDTLSFTGDFRKTGEKAATSVPWIAGGSSQVMLASAPGEISQQQMEHIAQMAHVAAVAFASLHFGFSADMKALYLFAIMHVYARGEGERTVFLDGGILIAGAKFDDTSPALGTSGIEGIAASKRDDDEALGARAKLWFANDGARVRQAFNKADDIFTEKLHNFLIARRGTANPYKQ